MGKCLDCGKKGLLLRTNEYGRCEDCEKAYQEKKAKRISLEAEEKAKAEQIISSQEEKCTNAPDITATGYTYDTCTPTKLIDFPNSYIVIDLETSGLIYNKNSIIELAAIKVKDGIVVETYSSLVHRDKPLNKKITELTGITTSMLRSCDKDLPDVMDEFRSFIGDSILVGHNILGFDIKFINEAYKKVYCEQIKNQCIDTLKIARNCCDSENFKLADLAETLGIQSEKSGYHRALYDCDITMKLYNILAGKCIEQYFKWSKSGKFIQEDSKKYPMYITSIFCMNDPIGFHKELINNGYFEEADKKTMLMTLKAVDLKEILSSHSIKPHGSKEILVDLVIENNIDVDIPKIYLPSQYGRDNCFNYAYKQEQ